MTVRFPTFQLPGVPTTYECMPLVFNFTSDIDVQQIDPVIINSAVVHHMILFWTDTYLNSSTLTWACPNLPNGQPV